MSTVGEQPEAPEVKQSDRPSGVIGKALSLHPIVWAGGYVSLFALAAVVYVLLPSGSFYDSNLHREPSTHADELRLTANLSREVEAEPRATKWRQGKEKVTQALLGPPRVVGVTLPPNAVPNTLAVGIDAAASSSLGSRNYEDWFSIDLQHRIVFTNVDGGDVRVTYSATPTGFDGVGAPVQNVPQPPSTVLLPNVTHGDAPTLNLTRESAGELEQFYMALQGDTTAGSSRFLRMIYFSASTVTTLGIGDIQPVSPLARLLVTLEAIFGVVFIGLFLNALARRIQG
jgi:hypothetical protein